jgi:multisubunit Na+/H+ antiporter MnhF subunit
MFNDKAFWEIVLSTIPVWFLVLVTLFTLSFDGGNVVEIAVYSILYSFLSALILYRFLKKG